MAKPYLGTHQRVYTQEQPLIYEDAWEKWPYAFINDKGEPDGFNVELVRKMMKRLNIPYAIHLRSQDDAHHDLKTNRADLSFGVNAGYNAAFGRFGRRTVCYFNNAIIQCRADSAGPYKLEDLKKFSFSVKNDSRAYHYVIANGFSDSLITCVDNMEEEVLRIATEGRGAALWNAMMLKWMVNKYHLTDLAVSPVDIPPGKYCFMSSDTVLLAKLDSLCEIMQVEGEIDRMEQRWMYPEREIVDYTYLYIVLSLMIIIIVVIASMYFVKYYRRYYSRNTLHDINSQMGLVLTSNHMQVWVYYPLTRRYAWMTRDGKVNAEYVSFDFSQFYPDQDFNIIHTQVMDFLAHDSAPVVKTLRSYSLNHPGKILDVEVHMQVLKDDYGKIYLICGVQHDITDSKAALDRMRMLHERHKVAFNIALGAILRFDGNGTLVDVNDRCCIKMGIRDKEAVLRKGFHFNDFGVFDDFDIDTMPDDLRFTAFINNRDMKYYAPIANFDSFNPDPETHPDFYTKKDSEDSKHKVPKVGYYYIHLIKSHDTEGKLISIMMFMLDITHKVHEERRKERVLRHISKFKKNIKLYDDLRDYTLASNGIFMMRYRPDTKMLTIFDLSNNSHTFSQLHVLEFVDAVDMKRVFRVFRKVDSYADSDIHLNVTTMLRNSNGEKIHYSIDVHPVKGKSGSVENYFGICCDVTDKLNIQKKLKDETQRAREAEQLRQMFLKNMSYSIRQPLVSIRQNIEHLATSSAGEENTDERYLRNIVGNTQRLIMLSDDTLLLSRIEAGLFTVSKKDVDFVSLFADTVNEVIGEYISDTVIFNVENTYSKLVVNADPDMLKRIIHEAVSLAVRFVQYGTCNIRYFYRRGKMSISVQDTGNGIPPSMLENLFEPRIGDAYVTDMQNHQLSGLEMPICKALVELMEGKIEIDSERGKGTSIYIELPLEESVEQ